MMKLPLLISMPHVGLRVPDEVAGRCILTPREVERDGDEGAAAIYQGLRSHVAELVASDVARAVVDLNRAEDDFRPDGVIKTHTCWNEPVYADFPDAKLIETLLAKYHRPYHRRLTELSARADLVLAIDAHTMAAQGPPVGPDPGATRPWACLSNADGTCPQDWIESLADCFREHFSGPVTINAPFKGGYITRTHAAEMPWVQLELSRGSFLTDAEKHKGVLAALRAWCARR